MIEGLKDEAKEGQEKQVDFITTMTKKIKKANPMQKKAKVKSKKWVARMKQRQIQQVLYVDYCRVNKLNMTVSSVVAVVAI